MRSGHCERLIVFTRYPEPGRVKTRLIPTLGPAGAAELHRQMTADTLARVDHHVRVSGTEAEVRFSGGSAQAMAELFGVGRLYVTQGEGDLGSRLSRAFDEAFTSGCDQVTVIGTDCPAMTADLMGLAFRLLPETDLVLGPAVDGGYYLLGLRRMVKEMFEGIPGGSGEVLHATLEASRRLGLSVQLLTPLADVDRPEDLALLGSWPDLRSENTPLAHKEHA